MKIRNGAFPEVELDEIFVSNIFNGNGLAPSYVPWYKNTIRGHYVRRPSSLARLHEFAWFSNLSELYLDREDHKG